MVKIHVFDEDKLSRRVLDRTWPILGAKSAENDPKMAPQDDPKSTKNRRPKMIEILIEKKSVLVIHLGRSGGMRWPPGGIIGGAKTSHFEICRCLRHIMALRFRRFSFRSSTPCSAPPGRAADCLPLWGDTAARPPTFGMPCCQFAAGHLSRASWIEF